MDIKQISKRSGVGIVAISEGIGLSRGAASLWGDEVPSERVLAVCEFVEWKVTPHQVRPDLYPHPMDGLPAPMRSGECKDDRPEPEVRSRSCGDRREDERRSTDDTFGEFGERRGTDRRDDDRRTTCADESAV